MIHGTRNAMRLQAQRASQAIISTRTGSLTSFDPNTWTARVQLQPDDVITGWLQVASPWVGNGWGLFAPPNIGDQVDIECVNGDLQSATIVGRFWNQVSLPLAVDSGEFWLVHAKGAYFKLLNTGAVEFSDGQGASITFDGAGNITSAANSWTHTGNVTVDGTLTATTDVVGNGTSLHNHHHAVPGVQSGSSTATSNPPS